MNSCHRWSLRRLMTKRHRRIEMRAGDRPKRQDQHHKNRASRHGVAEEGESDVSTCQPLAHDSRTDDRRHQESCSEAFGRQAFGERKCHALATRRPAFITRSPSSLMNCPCCGGSKSRASSHGRERRTPWRHDERSVHQDGVVTLRCEEARDRAMRIFKRPRRPVATYSSPRCVARGLIELT